MLTLNKSHLRAAMHCAAKKDVRYYLVGVYLECAINGDLHIVGCDGHILFAGLVPAPYVKWTDVPQVGPWSMIIPLDTVKNALKANKSEIIDLVVMPDGRYMIGSTVFNPIDGVYPDWRRVAKWPDAQPEPGQYNPDLLVQVNSAVKEWFDGGSKWTGHLHQFGTSSAVYTGDNMTGFAIIMPYRPNDPDIRPFTPSSYK